jgi:hypothetical protein
MPSSNFEYHENQRNQRGILLKSEKENYRYFLHFAHLDKIRRRGYPRKLLLLLLIFYKYFPLKVLCVKTLLM